MKNYTVRKICFTDIIIILIILFYLWTNFSGQLDINVYQEAKPQSNNLIQQISSKSPDNVTDIKSLPSSQNLSTDNLDNSKPENGPGPVPSVAGLSTQIDSTNQNDAQQDEVGKEDQLYLVTRVIDGDTIELANGEVVRYIGIDTPETVHPSKPVGCYGREASNKNKELVFGQKVRLESDITDRDKYNRLLRYVYLEDGTFINLLLVSEGYARNYTYPPDVKFQQQFLTAEKNARGANLGLWGADCSDICDIKGNISADGLKIYHVPGQKYYNKTSIDESKGEKWFCSEEEAISAGWRKSKI